MKSIPCFTAALLVTWSFLRLISDMVAPFKRCYTEVPLVKERVESEGTPDIYGETTTLRGTSTKKEFPTQCQDMVSRFRNATTDRKPVIIAGYPGSGNTVTRELVESLTGFEAADLYAGEKCLSNRVVTCKTHFPVYDFDSPNMFPDRFAPTAALLIRNPADALPSYFNFCWERTQNVSEHSQQGSEEEWIKFRDAHFDAEIEGWNVLLNYWLKEKYVQTVLPYERLTDPKEGPQIVKQLMRHLESAGFPVATDFECQWYKTVVRSAKSKRNGRQYVPKYTSDQKLKLLEVINRTMVDLEGHSIMTPILSQYMMDISQSVDLVEG